MKLNNQKWVIIISVTLVITFILSIIPGTDMTIIDGPQAYGFPFTSFVSGGLVAPDAPRISFVILGVIGNTAIVFGLVYLLMRLGIKQRSKK